MAANITKPLHDEGFAFNSRSQAQFWYQILQ
jgi:hypothetical protein